MSDQLTDEQVAWHVKYHNADWARHNLACEVQAFRRDEPLVIAMGQRIDRFEKLIADLRELHAPELDEADGLSVWCAECDPDCIDTYPCPTIRLIEEAGI